MPGRGRVRCRIAIVAHVLLAALPELARGFVTEMNAVPCGHMHQRLATPRSLREDARHEQIAGAPRIRAGVPLLEVKTHGRVPRVRGPVASRGCPPPDRGAASILE